MYENNLAKKKILEFAKFQFPVILIMVLFGLILTYKKFSPLNTILSLALLYYFSYICHVFAHYKPDSWFNFHMLFHHCKDKNISNQRHIINWFAEVFSNIFMFLVTFMILKYIIQYIFKVDFVPAILIFYYGIIYVTAHNINYSIFHVSESHIIHHKKANSKGACNYGPDIFDHIFGTNYNSKLENIWHLLPNIIISFLITYYLFKPNNLISEKFIVYLIILHAINLILFKVKNIKY